MPRYSFEDAPQSPAATTLPTVPPASERSVRLTRGLGLALLLFGFAVSVAVMVEAWSLYRAPTAIERLAKAIEHGSNLDHALSRASRNARAPDETVAEHGHARSEDAEEEPMFGFRFSYFIAWVIALLLLMLIGRLALAAIRTGGELVLYERHVQRLAREIIRETRKAQG